MNVLRCSVQHYWVYVDDTDLFPVLLLSKWVFTRPKEKQTWCDHPKKCCPTGVPAHTGLSVSWRHGGSFPAAGALVTLGAVLSDCLTVSLIEHQWPAGLLFFLSIILLLFFTPAFITLLQLHLFVSVNEPAFFLISIFEDATFYCKGMSVLFYLLEPL